MKGYQKLVSRNYVAFADIFEMRDIVRMSNADGYFVRVVEFVNGAGLIEYWK